MSCIASNEKTARIHSSMIEVTGSAGDSKCGGSSGDGGAVVNPDGTSCVTLAFRVPASALDANATLHPGDLNLNVMEQHQHSESHTAGSFAITMASTTTLSKLTERVDEITSEFAFQRRPAFAIRLYSARKGRIGFMAASERVAASHVLEVVAGGDGSGSGGDGGDTGGGNDGDSKETAGRYCIDVPKWPTDIPLNRLTAEYRFNVSSGIGGRERTEVVAIPLEFLPGFHSN